MMIQEKLCTFFFLSVFDSFCHVFEFDPRCVVRFTGCEEEKAFVVDSVLLTIIILLQVSRWMNRIIINNNNLFEFKIF